MTVTIGVVGLLAAAVALGAGGAAAQTADTAEFSLMRGAQRLTVERVTRGGGRLTGDLTVGGGAARLTYTARTDTAELVPELEFAAYLGGGAEPAVSASLAFHGDSASARVRSPGSAPEQRFAPGPGAMPYINLACGILEQLVRRARVVGGDRVEIPLLAVENGATMRATVTRLGPDSVSLLLPPGVELRLRVDAAGRLLGGSVPAQGVTIVRRGEAAGAPAPPAADYAAPAGAPYSAEEVRVPTPRGYALAGTLTLPRQRAGPVPAVVLVTGSGPQDRDSAIPAVAGYRPFRQVADALSSRGLAVLRLDDRGVGASGGDPTRATSADFADDLRAALAWLRTRGEVDGRRLGLVGHSEGGMIAPMVAVDDPGVRAVVLMAAQAWTGRRVSDYQLRDAWRRAGRSPAQMDSLRAVNDPQREAVAARSPWVRFFLDYDPLPTARLLRAPVLVLQGATDHQVAPEQAAELAAAIRSAGNRDVTLRVFPGLDHLFLPDPAGTADVQHYAGLPSKQIPAEVLDLVAGWLTQRLR